MAVRGTGEAAQVRSGMVPVAVGIFVGAIVGLLVGAALLTVLLRLSS